MLKEEGEFSKDRNQCKQCRREYYKEYDTKRNKTETRIAWNKNNRNKECNKIKSKDRNKKYYEDNKECVKERVKVYKIINKDIISSKAKQYYHDNKDVISESQKEYYENNKVDIIANVQKWYFENKEHRAEYMKEYYNSNIDYIRLKAKKWYDENIIVAKASRKLWRDRNLEKSKLDNKNYRPTPHGKEVKKRSEDKRNRDLGWTPINTKFDGSVGHHLLYNGEYNKDVGIGIYIPKGLHTIGHGRKNPIKQREMNIIASKWLIDNAETEEIWIIASYLYSRYTELPAPIWLKDEYYNRYIKNEC